jgi:hypothetical protein
MPAGYTPDTDVEATKRAQRARAAAVVFQIIQDLHPSDPALRSQRLNELDTHTEAELRQSLDNTMRGLRESLAEPLPKNLTTAGFYSWMMNQYSAVQFQRRYIDMYALAIISRGFAPADDTVIAALDERAAKDMQVLHEVIADTARQLGFEEGTRHVQQQGWLAQVLAAITEITKALIALGEQAVKFAVQTGIGLVVGLGVATALMLFLLSRR